MKNKLIFGLVLALFLTSVTFAQVENTVKETKVKIDKTIKKVDGVKESAKEVTSEVKESCSTEEMKACCASELKEAGVSKMAHGKDCKCEGCSKGHKMGKEVKEMKEAHSASCTCGGCKTKATEMHKEHKDKKEHGENCSCDGCKKS